MQLRAQSVPALRWNDAAVVARDRPWRKCPEIVRMIVEIPKGSGNRKVIVDSRKKFVYLREGQIVAE